MIFFDALTLRPLLQLWFVELRPSNGENVYTVGLDVRVCSIRTM